MTYVPIYGVGCFLADCDEEPVVGIVEEHCVRCTCKCGWHFFWDKHMIDPDNWNEPVGAME